MPLNLPIHTHFILGYCINIERKLCIKNHSSSGQLKQEQETFYTNFSQPLLLKF